MPAGETVYSPFKAAHSRYSPWASTHSTTAIFTRVCGMSRKSSCAPCGIVAGENAEDEDKHREDKPSRAVERNGAISRALLHPARSGDFIGVREGRRTASPPSIIGRNGAR